MIKARNIIKLGKNDTIFAISDHLKLNDFTYECGILQTTPHNKYSRIRFEIVKNKNLNSNSLPGVFNMNPDEVFNLFDLIQDPMNPLLFKKNLNNNVFEMLKIHYFSKDENGFSAVFNFKLSYEEKINNNSKWKFSIETGKAIANKSENSNGGKLYFPKKDTYKKLSTTSFFMTSIDLKNIIFKVKSHINNWENVNYSKMLAYRDAFEMRAKLNKFNEDTIQIWNSRNSIEDLQCKNTIDNNTDINTTSSTYIDSNINIKSNDSLCEICNKPVRPEIGNLNKSMIGKYICFACKNNLA